MVVILLFLFPATLTTVGRTERTALDANDNIAPQKSCLNCNTQENKTILKKHQEWHRLNSNIMWLLRHLTLSLFASVHPTPKAAEDQQGPLNASQTFIKYAEIPPKKMHISVGFHPLLQCNFFSSRCYSTTEEEEVAGKGELLIHGGIWLLFPTHMAFLFVWFILFIHIICFCRSY